MDLCAVLVSMTAKRRLGKLEWPISIGRRNVSSSPNFWLRHAEDA
jgi:hypothetical protein